MTRIDSKTRIIGLLGYPLGHSFSPTMQNGAFESMGINKIYVPIEVTPENLSDVVKGMSKMNFDGFNVTIPHKIHIMDYLHEVDELAKIIGAVNVVTIEDGHLKGYNTDGIGFVKSFEEQTGMTFQGRNIFIIGSGGASRAISMTLAIRGVNRIYICNRTLKKAKALSEDINRQVRNCSIPIVMEYSAMESALKDTEVIINTTSVGMHPNVSDIPIDKNLLKERFVVCDIVYNPRRTELLKKSEMLGCVTVGGLEMLVYQGAESFKLWTGVEPPVAVMFDVVEKVH